MRALPPPNKSVESTLTACLLGVGDPQLATNYRNTIPDFKLAGNDYRIKAAINDLHSINESTEANEEVITNNLTKKNIKDLYSSYFSKKEKPARAIYDELMILSKNNICPYCGCGRVGTLDHFLPKSKYPFLSVLVENLVPSCWACNTDKRTSIATSAEQQPLHPYYDHELLNNKQWLFASIGETLPPTVIFNYETPEDLDDICCGRIKSHFIAYNLSSVCADYANSELSDNYLDDKKNFLTHGAAFLKETFEEKAANLAYSNLNYWRTAMYQALAKSDWYCNGNFIRP